MNCILLDLFYNPPQAQNTIFDKIVESLFTNAKITKLSYNILRSHENPMKTEYFWVDALGINDDDIDWASIHEKNFKSTIETQIRAFSFQSFSQGNLHKPISP